MLQVDFDYPYAAAISSGASTFRVLAMGNNPSVDTNTQPEDVWAGAELGTLNGINHAFIPRPQVPTSMEVVSDSAADTSAGLGARTVNITYLDANWRMRSVTLTLNGLTPVPLPTTAMRINLFQVATVGTFGAANTGNLSIRLVGGLGATFAYMQAGIGNARSSLYTCPEDLRFDLISSTLSINRAFTGDRWASLNICLQDSTGRLIKGTELSVSTATPYRHETAGFPLVAMTPRTDVWVRCEAVSSSNTNISASLTGIQRNPLNITL